MALDVFSPFRFRKRKERVYVISFLQDIERKTLRKKLYHNRHMFSETFNIFDISEICVVGTKVQYLGEY